MELSKVPSHQHMRHSALQSLGIDEANSKVDGPAMGSLLGVPLFEAPAEDIRVPGRKAVRGRPCPEVRVGPRSERLGVGADVAPLASPPPKDVHLRFVLGNGVANELRWLQSSCLPFAAASKREVQDSRQLGS